MRITLVLAVMVIGNGRYRAGCEITEMSDGDRKAVSALAAIASDGGSEEQRNPDALVNLSLAQNAAGQAGDAQASLRRALEIDPHNAAAHYNLALQFEKAGEASAAIDHYNKFIQNMGPEQSSFAADVRVRLAALAARIK